MSEAAAASQSAPHLRRDVSVWGSYMWGFADVGADTYVALGLVIAASQGGAALSFALAGLVYIFIGLAYTELAAAYPVAGGGQYFALRGLGDFWGMVAGSALLLDYTIDISLFALASAGYFNYLVQLFTGFAPQAAVISLGSLVPNFQWLFCLETLLLIGFLLALNIKGMRESSLLNEVVGILVICLESLLVLLGFLFAWKPELLAQQWHQSFPPFGQFLYGSTLAIISFVGLESISQAAQETRRPATVIPRTSISLIFTVFIFAVSFSVMGLGILDWQVFAANKENPIAKLAEAIPGIGLIAGPFAAVLGAIVLLISSNSGVMSASRVTYSMSQFGLISKWFDKVHPRFHTPVRTILVFSGIGALETIIAFLTKSAISTLADMYAFGATFGYTLVFISLIVLRFKDPHTPRPYQMPLNVGVNWKGTRVSFPLLGIIGALSVFGFLLGVIYTHRAARIAGPAWVVMSALYYLWYRKSHRLPILGNLHRDWEKDQIQVLTSAEEFDLLEQYRAALARRDKIKGGSLG